MNQFLYFQFLQSISHRLVEEIYLITFKTCFFSDFPFELDKFRLEWHSAAEFEAFVKGYPLEQMAKNMILVSRGCLIPKDSLPANIYSICQNQLKTYCV